MATQGQKRKARTISEKLSIIERIRKGESQASVSRELSIPESTLRGWLKDESKLRATSIDMEGGGQKRKRSRLAKDPKLESAVYTWFTQERAEGVPISGPVLQAQALKFSKQLGSDDTSFKASSGWLTRFKGRHEISQVTIRGEQRSADEDAAAAFPAQLRTLIEDGGYTGEQVYNCDETALYYRLLPDRTLASRSDANKSAGYKQNKERLSVLFACNSTGSHKLTPLVIGKFGKPRCFHHVNMSSLPCLYRHSKNAWMTTTIFEEWFHKEFVVEVRRHLRRQKLEGKAILLMDHCPAHPAVDKLTSRDGKIKAVFLPKNTTSKIQPLDQGIIATFKRNYRRDLVNALVNSTKSVTEYLRGLNLKEAMHLGGLAWSAVTARSIRGCWRKGLGEAFTTADVDSDEEDFSGFSREALDSAVEKLASARQDFTDETRFNETDFLTARTAFGDITQEDLDQWIAADEDVATFERLTEEDIVSRLTDGATATEEEPAEEEEETPPAPVSSVVSGLETAVGWWERHPEATSLSHLRSILFQARSDARGRCKQTKLEKYFDRASSM